MLNLSFYGLGHRSRADILANWEEDIERVGIEPCDVEDDPLGYQAIYYSGMSNDNGSDDNIEISYSIGASCLSKRLSLLKKGGFCAPMTEEAILLMRDKFRARRPL